MDTSARYKYLIYYTKMMKPNRKRQCLTPNNISKPVSFHLTAVLNWLKECLFRMKSERLTVETE